jgi:chaperonin GroES
MNIKPLDNRVVVKPAEAESTTSGGIVLPESAKEKQTRGKVLQVGPGRLLDSGKRVPPAVSVGDEVYYGQYAGTEIKIDDQKYVILEESELLGVVTR